MYQSAEEMVKEGQRTAMQITRLAEVTSLDSKGRAKVKFFGEDTESGKTYTYIEGYIPEVGDKVLMLGQGNTFIIIGEVTEKEVIVKYALKDHNHDSVYVKSSDYEKHTHSKLIKGDASLEVTPDGEVMPGAKAAYSLGTEDMTFAEGHVDNIVVKYITIDGVKLEKDDLISKLIASGNDDYYVELETADLLPHANLGISLGTSSKMFKNVYAQAIYSGGKQVYAARVVDAITTGRYIELSSSVLEPSAHEVISIGGASKRFLKIYAKQLYGDEFHGGKFYAGDYELSPSKMYADDSKSKYIEFSGNVIKPNVTKNVDLGNESYQYNKIYAAELYLDGVKLGKADLISKLISDSNTNCYVVLEGTDLIPYTNQGIGLGTSTRMFKNVYAKEVYIDGVKVDPAKLMDAVTSGRYIELSSSSLLPSATDVISIGSASRRFQKNYAKQFYGDSFYVGNYELSPSKMYSNNNTSRYVEFSGTVINPNTSKTVDLGSEDYQYSKVYAAEIYVDGRRMYPYRIYADAYPDSRYIDITGAALKPSTAKYFDIGTYQYQYKNTYTQNLYVDGSAITSSDKKKKKFIRNLASKYMNFFKKLRPVTYKYKEGTSDRTHAGFIAQEVEQAMKECDIANKEFGGLVIQDNGEYGLRYEEFIALQTAAIHDLQARVEKLERRLEEHGIEA